MSSATAPKPRLRAIGSFRAPPHPNAAVGRLLGRQRLSACFGYAVSAATDLCDVCDMTFCHNAVSRSPADRLSPHPADRLPPCRACPCLYISESPARGPRTIRLLLFEIDRIGARFDPCADLPPFATENLFSQTFEGHCGQPDDLSAGRHRDSRRAALRWHDLADGQGAESLLIPKTRTGCRTGPLRAMPIPR